jgi:hypothetical protein
MKVTQNFKITGGRLTASMLDRDARIRTVTLLPDQIVTVRP